MESVNLKQIFTLKSGQKIIQNTQNFMFGIDAFLLADFTLPFIKKNDFVIDLGTGTGIIPFLLENRSKASFFYGLEIQKESFCMAKKSVELNNLQNKISIIHGDIKKVDELFTKHSFQIVVSNPPYMSCKEGKINPNDSKSIARHEILCNLNELICSVDYLLKPHGRFFMIHKATRLSEIFETLRKYNLEPKRIKLIQPNIKKPANLVLIEARKNAQSGIKYEPTLFVYDKNGEYSDEVKRIQNFS